MYTSDDEFDFEHDIKDSSGLNQTEKKLYHAMKSIGLSPVPQYKISRMTVDFAFPNERLAIEINGPYHNSEKQKLKDSKRYFVMQKNGWNRKSFDSNRVYEKPFEVAYIIRNLLIKHTNSASVLLHSKKDDTILKNMWDRICGKQKQ